jgi:hypothetical protein
VRGRQLRFALLALAALAVFVENALFFRGRAPASHPDEYADEATADGDAGAGEGALPPLSYSQVLEYGEHLPGPARSPFLTLAEAERLAQRGRGAPAPGEGLALPTLSGTLWSPARRVAWIDGSPRTEGDAVAGHRLVRIETRAAVLRRGDETLRLEIEAPDRGTSGEADDEEAEMPRRREEDEW